MKNSYAMQATNFVAQDRPQFGIPRLYCWCWHFTTDGNIATSIVSLIHTMIPLSLLEISWTLVQ